MADDVVSSAAAAPSAAGTAPSGQGPTGDASPEGKRAVQWPVASGWWLMWAVRWGSCQCVRQLGGVLGCWGTELAAGLGTRRGSGLVTGLSTGLAAGH